MSTFKYRFRIMEYRVIDGDSVEAVLDLGLGLTTTEIIRLANIDAPETRTRDLVEKEAGLIAKAWLLDHMILADELICESIQFNRGKFGRLIGYIIADSVNLNEQMVIEGHATVY